MQSARYGTPKGVLHNPEYTSINISLLWSEERMRLSPRILSLFWLRLCRSVRPLCLRAACGETIGRPSYPQEAQRTQRSHKDL